MVHIFFRNTFRPKNPSITRNTLTACRCGTTRLTGGAAVFHLQADGGAPASEHRLERSPQPGVQGTRDVTYGAGDGTERLKKRRGNGVVCGV